MKQYAPACERNRGPILAVLEEIFAEPGLVLEIGSGTGQHAVWFARALPHLIWQPTERPGVLDSIRAWREEAALDNLRPPLALDLDAGEWPVEKVDYIVCINTIHIASWEAVRCLFQGAGARLRGNGILYAYGPYRYRGRPLEPSNKDFDRWLRQRDPRSGVREFEAVDALATEAGLVLGGDRAMPANNRSLWWHRAPA